MKTKKHIFFGFSLLAIVSLMIVACSRLDMVGMFAGTSPTIDERVEESLKYNKQHGFVTLQAPAETYHVHVCTDTHITDTRRRWEYFIDQYRHGA